MKIGFLGAGGIARKMAFTIYKLENPENMKKTLEQMQEGKEDGEPLPLPEVECTAVAARDRKRAEIFADTFGFRKAYGSYEELLADQEIQMVYIALPHSLHCKWTKEALKAGKHVLCEKAFAMNETQAREMTELAREKKKMLAEAIWTRYMPSRRIIEDIIKKGELGEVHTVSANLGYPVSKKERMIRQDLGGGALLDLMVYPLNFASMVLGNRIKGISASYIKDAHGVDGQDQVILAYEEGKMAALFATMYTMTDRTGWIYGEQGILEVQNINNPEGIRLYRHKEGHEPFLVKEYKIPPQITGYEYEAAACALASLRGEGECKEMPHEETIEMMRQLDQIRKNWNCF